MKCHFLILCVFVKAIAGHISSGWSPSYVQPVQQSYQQSYTPVQQSYQQSYTPVQESYQKPYTPVQQGYQQSYTPVQQSYHQNIAVVPVVPIIPVHEQTYDYAPPQHLQSVQNIQSVQQNIQSSPVQYQGYHGISAQQYVPQDTPEVQAAKAQHFAAYAKALALVSKGGQGIEQQYIQQGNQFYHGQTQGIQSANLNAYVPEDTPEVQQAKAAHLQAHARARAHLSAWSQPSNQWAQQLDGAYSGAQQGYYQHQQAGPVDTPEVQAAKSQHFLAHQRVRSGNFAIGDQSFGIGSIHGQGPQHPVDTPEVQAAKAQHFAAYEAELAKHRQLASTQNSLSRKETPHY